MRQNIENGERERRARKRQRRLREKLEKSGFSRRPPTLEATKKQFSGEKESGERKTKRKVRIRPLCFSYGLFSFSPSSYCNVSLSYSPAHCAMRFEAANSRRSQGLTAERRKEKRKKRAEEKARPRVAGGSTFIARGNRYIRRLFCFGTESPSFFLNLGKWVFLFF